MSFSTPDLSPLSLMHRLALCGCLRETRALAVGPSGMQSLTLSSRGGLDGPCRLHRTGSSGIQGLGSTADLLGDELRAWTERRLRNLGNIFSTLEHKYGSEGIEGLDEGAISPRVLRGILNEGSYIEDEVGTEYYGGVLRVPVRLMVATTARWR